MKLIERSYYLNKLQAVKDIPDIKVITGLRRSGKSKLLDAYANILERETTNNVIRIPLHFKKYEKLIKYAFILLLITTLSFVFCINFICWLYHKFLTFRQFAKNKF